MHLDDALGLVVGQRADLDAGRLTGAATGQRPHARFQFRQGEGLGQVVVGAGIEAAHAILDAVLRGQDQHRHGALARAQAAQHVDTGELGQAEIENQQIVHLRQQRRVGILAIVDMIDRIAGLAQGADQAIGNDGVVFGKKNSHDADRFYL